MTKEELKQSEARVNPLRMLPELEEKYPVGSDITIMNSYYNYPVFQDGKKVMDDVLALVYKDNKTSKKDFITIQKPYYTFYKLKDGIDVPVYNQLFVERDKVDAVEVPFVKLDESIAKATGNIDFYKNNVYNHNKAANRRLHMEPNIFFSDTEINNHYRFRFAQNYTNNITKLYKGFFDIEVDGKWAKGDFTELGECAINCVSYYDERSNTVYTFCLRDLNNPLIEEFEKEIHDGVFTIKDIKKFIKDAVGGDFNFHRYHLNDIKYKIQFYEYEIELIKDLFHTIHQCSPDFVEGWNSSAFDIPYIIERIRVLGYDPADIMCDQRWNYRVVKNYVDEKNINKPAERGDYTFISGLVTFIDQMIQYASRRKSKIGSIGSTKLDDIGEREVGIHKLDYSYITDKVTELPWLNFKIFVLYNIMDVIVQKCIEQKTQDLEYIFTKCIVNNTSYNKGHRQTVYLINRMANDWYKKGYIIGNNTNVDNEKPPKYLGALVGDPLNTNDYSKIKINGRPIWICDNLIDFDFKSLYPSIMAELNIAPNTQIGRIFIDKQVYDNENAYNNDRYNRGGEFIENMITDNFIEFCHRYFKLANIEQMIDDIDEFFSTSGFGKYSEIEEKYNAVIIPTSKDAQSPIVFSNDRRVKVVSFYNKRNESLTYDNLIGENAV